jgi:hypothetical protein
MSSTNGAGAKRDRPGSLAVASLAGGASLQLLGHGDDLMGLMAPLARPGSGRRDPTAGPGLLTPPDARQ